MKIGFLTACLPQVGLEKLVAWASAEGFKALELAAWPIFSNRDYQAQQINAAKFSNGDAFQIRELFSKYSMEISAMAYYDNNLHPDLEKRNAYLNHLKKVITAASMLGVKLVGTFVGSDPNLTPNENIKEIKKVFSDLLKFAEDKGLNLMIENCPMENWVKFGLPGNFAYSPELWDALFNELPNKNFGLNLDPSHLYWLGIDYLKATAKYAPKVFHVHAKDTEILPQGKYKYGILGRQISPVPWQSGWWRYRVPGQGEIDWAKFISILKKYGYNEILSIEHEDPDYEGSEEKIKAGLKLGLKHLSKFCWE